MRVGWFLALAGLACAQTTVIRPKESKEILVNPGMGIQTFQRFAGQEIYPGKRWSERGTLEKVEDSKTPVDFPTSSVAYLRWFWNVLEPEQGKYRWDILDLALDEARRHHQKLAIRVMPYDQRDPLPEWYRNSGARRINKPTDKDGEIWSPDSSDPFYIEHWSELVRRMGERYDGHPYLDSVDISTVGYWGEGWGPYLPSWQVQQELLDLYFKAFRRTKLLVNFDEPNALTYGVKQGAGWRLDCWGDMGRPGRNFAHMVDMYPQQIARMGIGEAWRGGPVSLEVCGTPLSWKDGNYELKPILDQALRWHASTINLKSTRIPEEWKAAFDEFQKQIGYRLVLRRFEYPQKVKIGQVFPVKMWWLNAGAAPPYDPYTLALRVGGVVLRIAAADVRKWLPGDAVVEEPVYVDPAIPAGKQKVSIALLDPRTQEPAVKLAIEGGQADGWYELGEVVVE